MLEMTALKPLENRRVTGVASERYPLNKKCAHPECDQDAVDPHHAFPRSAIGNDSWFVSILEDGMCEGDRYNGTAEPLPHVTGLCRAHHEDVEQHRAWIKLEDGVFLWYDRQTVPGDPTDDALRTRDVWHCISALNPQPGSVEGKPKRKKRTKQPARKKAVYSIRVPKDEGEDGYEVLSTLVEANRERLVELMGWTDTVADYFVLCAVLSEGLQ